MTMEAYQVTSPNIVVVPQIFSEVGVIHELENESQRILWGGVHSDEWHSVQALETTARQCLFVKPLPVDLQ